MALAPEREVTVWQIKDRNVQDVQITVPDRPDPIESKVHLLRGKLPRRRSRFAQTGGKKPVVDMIGLAAKLFESTTGETDVPVFQE